MSLIISQALAVSQKKESRSLFEPGNFGLALSDLSERIAQAGDRAVAMAAGKLSPRPLPSRRGSLPTCLGPAGFHRLRGARRKRRVQCPVSARWHRRHPVRDRGQQCVGLPYSIVARRLSSPSSAATDMVGRRTLDCERRRAVNSSVAAPEKWPSWTHQKNVDRLTTSPAGRPAGLVHSPLLTIVDERVG